MANNNKKPYPNDKEEKAAGKSSYKGKNHRSRSKGSDKYERKTGKFNSYDALKSNDVAWYNKNPIQYQLATKTPTFAQIQGTPYSSGKALPLDGSGDLGGIYGLSGVATNVIPGVMIADFVPTIGLSTGNTSPVNKAFTRLMSELYARTSGSSLNFQQADLAMLLISMSSLSSLFAHAKRALSTRSFWITRNANYPTTLLKALGVGDYDDMIENYNSYVIRLNDLIAQFNAIKIPAWFDIFARHYSLAKNVYLDEDSEFGQIFAFRPHGVWKYDDSKGTCKLRVIPHGATTKIGDLLDVIEECLGVWLNSSDLYLINGALLRAFGSDTQFIFIEPFEAGTLINPIVDEYLGMQIQNATIMGAGFVDEDWVISQNPAKNSVLFDPFADAGYAYDYRPAGVLAKAFKDQPTADDNMEMTRLSCITYSEAGFIHFLTCGTEVVTAITVYSTDNKSWKINSNVLNVAFETDRSSAWELISKIYAFGTFRYAPRICVVSSNATQCYGDILEMGDMYNYCVLAADDLAKMHETALYSIWKPTGTGFER